MSRDKEGTTKDFIFGVLAGPLAPIIEDAAGSSKEHINSSVMGAITGGTIAATTAGVILTAGAAAPAAAAADTAVVGTDAAAVGAEGGVVGGEVAGGAAAGGAATDVGAATTAAAAAPELTETAGETTAGLAEAATAAAPTTETAAAPAVTAATPDVISGSDAPLADAAFKTPEELASQGSQNQALMEGFKTPEQLQRAKDISTAVKATREGIGVANTTRNAMVQASKAATPPPTSIPQASISSSIGGESTMKPLENTNITSHSPLEGNSNYQSIFGNQPSQTDLATDMLKKIPPMIQPPPIQPIMSDITNKTNIKTADRSVKDFLSKLRTNGYT